MSWHIASWSGKGVASFHVFSFCCCRSNTVHSIPFFFGMHSIGIACFATAGTHHPAVVYYSIFQMSSEQNASGHLGNLCLSCFDSSIKGILCSTSQISGNFNGSGPSKSLYFSAISSHSWGISEHVYSLSSFFKPMDFWVRQFALSSSSLPLGCDFLDSQLLTSQEFLVPLVSMLSLKYSFCLSVGSPPPLYTHLPGCK